MRFYRNCIIRFFSSNIPLIEMMNNKSKKRAIIIPNIYDNKYTEEVVFSLVNILDTSLVCFRLFLFFTKWKNTYRIDRFIFMPLIFLCNSCVSLNVFVLRIYWLPRYNLDVIYKFLWCLHNTSIVFFFRLTFIYNAIEKIQGLFKFLQS